ncbi:hypothetical protein [Actinomadura sp. DC4]|uniref:hypothetical protein n=1 Tax=Actinomadura sp. DC4 TaxID=3055069 RepID=UPI0025AF15FC|nr:hypothetical protein [Actinomadura sp. DC4]MDN3354251.1 hypothetical protein [Actinomadura sp. DC4]
MDVALHRTVRRAALTSTGTPFAWRPGMEPRLGLVTDLVGLSLPALLTSLKRHHRRMTPDRP